MPTDKSEHVPFSPAYDRALIPDLDFITCEVIPHAAATTRIPPDTTRARGRRTTTRRAPRHLTLPPARARSLRDTSRSRSRSRLAARSGGRLQRVREHTKPLGTRTRHSAPALRRHLSRPGASCSVLVQHPASGSSVTSSSGMTSRDDDTASAPTTAGAAQMSSQMEQLNLGAESLTITPSAAAAEAPPPPQPPPSAQAPTAVETFSGPGVPYAHRFSTVSQGPVGEATLNGVLATDLICWERFRDVPCACSADGGGASGASGDATGGGTASGSLTGGGATSGGVTGGVAASGGATGGGECQLFHGFGSGKAGAHTRPPSAQP